MPKYLSEPFQVRKVSQTSFGITIPSNIVQQFQLTTKDRFYFLDQYQSMCSFRFLKMKKIISLLKSKTIIQSEEIIDSLKIIKIYQILLQEESAFFYQPTKDRIFSLLRLTYILLNIFKGV